jgi:hypothetical protein
VETCRIRLVGVLMAFACGMLPACAGGDGSNGAAEGGASAVPTAQAPTETATASTDPDALSGTFDIGGGHELYVECAGSGKPTIVLEAGDNSDIGQWSPIFTALTERTRTCAYDRAGLGRSEAAEGCRQLNDLLDDTEALFKVARIHPPFLLVGTSGGGYLMAGLAARRPADVAGLVLLETPKAITILTAEVREQIRCDAPGNVEHRDYRAVEHAVWDHRKRLGSFPMRIMTNDYENDSLLGDEKTNVEDQRGWLVLSSNSKQIVVTSGHDVVWNETDLSLKLILEVLREAQ